MKANAHECLDDIELKRYGEEVLNASWLPHDLLKCWLDGAQGENDEYVSEKNKEPEFSAEDTEAFLQRVYWAQE